jgi:hypothetical protein
MLAINRSRRPCLPDFAFPISPCGLMPRQNEQGAPSNGTVGNSGRVGLKQGRALLRLKDKKMVINRMTEEKPDTSDYDSQRPETEEDGIRAEAIRRLKVRRMVEGARARAKSLAPHPSDSTVDAVPTPAVPVKPEK